MGQLNFLATVVLGLGGFCAAQPALATGDLTKVKHIIIVMQENHSFDNYFGVLPYAPKTPYHTANGSCAVDDHLCVDGLTCSFNANHVLVCTNSNQDDSGPAVRAFHSPTRCVVPDLNHGWNATHHEINYNFPNKTLTDPLSDGFVRVNDATKQVDTKEGPTEDQTMSYFNQVDLPFYYGLAKKFAISDRQFSSVLGPTIPNRFYLMAATSFGHLTSNDSVPPTGGYKPITGTIFNLLDKAGVTWADYFEDEPQSSLFRAPDSHTLTLSAFMQQAAGIGAALPQVVFVDPNFGANGTAKEDDEHPPTDIQRGQKHVSDVVSAIRNGPYWKNSIIFITHDEHGGFYDHAKPPAAHQNTPRTPDGIFPGQCEDLSNPPASEQPGGGAECASNSVSTTDTSVKEAEALCPGLAKDPTGPFPAGCAAFGQLGARVPLIAVSPFSKPHYVSHMERDHTAFLAMIEKRFLQQAGQPRPHLTQRDANAQTFEDMFDFDNSPSLNASVGSAAAPVNDCTPG